MWFWSPNNFLIAPQFLIVKIKSFFHVYVLQTSNRTCHKFLCKSKFANFTAWMQFKLPFYYSIWFLFRNRNKEENHRLTWCPTSHIILSSGVLKTWCRATVNSTTPKLELRCPPELETVCTMSALSSAASCSRSWQIHA